MNNKLHNKFTYFTTKTGLNFKSGLNFKNDFKSNSKIKNILYLLFFIIIIGLNIYLLGLILYTSRSSLSSSLSSSMQHNIIENFDIEKYHDICKNRKTHFYNLKRSKLSNAFSVSSNSECEILCSEGNCEIFLLKDLSNSTMKTCSLFNDIEGAYDISLTLNCESNILPQSDYGVYNGYGFVNKNYFQDNSNGFKYIDRYLEETEYIIDDLSYISYLNKKASKLDLTNINGKNFYDYLESQKINAYNNILNTINDVNSRIFNNSKNVLFTDLFNHSLSHNEISANILLTQPRDMSFINLINNSITTNNNTNLLNNKQNILLTNQNSINAVYLILLIIMILTIVLLILYNASIISEFILFSYFIFVILLIVFINNIVKI
jgi:hypothetical protein